MRSAVPTRYGATGGHGHGGTEVSSSPEFLASPCPPYKSYDTVVLMSRHVTPDFRQVGFDRPRFVNELTAKDHQDSIGEFEQFVKVLADQQHGRAAIARCHDLGSDLRDRGK